METEAKFVVPDEATFTNLQGIEQFGPYTRRDTRTKQVSDRYVDTANRDFFRNGLFVRLRQVSDGSLLVTLKRLGTVEGAIHSREEYEIQVSGLDPSQWAAGEVRSLVESVGGGRPFSDLFTIEQQRTVSHLYQGDRDVAELSLDDLTIQSDGGPVRSFEMEVELQPEGLISDLSILSRLLLDTYNLTAQPRSKFERALQLTGVGAQMPSPAGNTSGEQPPHEGDSQGTPTKKLGSTMAPAKSGKKDGGQSKPKGKKNLEAGASTGKGKKPQHTEGEKGRGVKTPILPTDPAAVAGRKLISYQVAEMKAKRGGALLGNDPDALHDMRVATRRMRAVFQVMQSYLAGPGVGSLRHGLRDLAHAQGAARDLDVLIEHAQEFRSGLPGEQQADMEGLISEWQANRAKAQKKLAQLLESKEYSNLEKYLKSFIEEPAEGVSRTDADVRPYQVRHIAGSAIWTQYEAVRAFETVMDAPTVDQLHALRIQGKYLRYTLECFRDVLPSAARDLIADVTHMQDQLGELHDADVAAGLVRDFAASTRKKKKGNNSEVPLPPGLASYLDSREEAVRQIASDFGATWATLAGVKWRLHLAEMVAGV